jgi:SAM-dependent methyltransferase
MSEWRLFEAGTVPHFTTREFFDAHPWIPPYHQMGHEERTVMTEAMIREVVGSHVSIGSLVDLGCGDGDLLRRLEYLGIRTFGITAGVANVEQARLHGLDVTLGDILGPLPDADLTVMTEVLEHLVDPHGMLARINSPYLVVSSPSAETDEWHYEHHAWAWDMDGYFELVAGAGWRVLAQGEVAAPAAHHNGQTREQRFQVIAATRELP